MSRPIFNRVTETPPFPTEAWLLSATWRGGHDKRLFLLENIYRSKSEALAEKARIDRGEHGFGPNFSGYESCKVERLTKGEGAKG